MAPDQDERSADTTLHTPWGAGSRFAFADPFPRKGPGNRAGVCV